MARHARRDRKFRLLLAAAVAIAVAFPIASASASSSGPSGPSATVRPRIVGGTEASITDFPYAVYLTDRRGYQFCGGVLVSHTAVATAAHCARALSRSEIRVVAGRQDERTDDGMTARVAKVWVEPGFSDPGKGDDVAVLTLDRAVPYQPVSLPGQNDPRLYAEGTTATVVGWGRTTDGGSRSEYLRRAELPVASDTGCADSYPNYDARSMVCAGYPDGGIDACQGDSGGPLLVGDTLIGIVSWGDGCAKPGKPGVYTRVASYSDEIRAAARLDSLF
ncbi:serine protease [Amycolatopsis cynarae]|uniref:Serine protease n=1 Tax=Amycolatopsis cynarae TaxID=2995223 RepID=A0ABY7B008_9PSEU|nr:serine protease [Amycolatopsis sp. HUAS 11-8]WAL64178.1 serine protease [Amycolatopsis sp. HUAS 11-8]